MKHLHFNKFATRIVMAAMMCMSAWGSHVSAQTAESYVVFDATDGTLTFKHDAAKPAGAYELNKQGTPQWATHKATTKKVVFDASFAAARPTNCGSWFNEFINLESIINIENLNTEKVYNMANMFRKCEKLSSLDLKTFNTKGAKNFYSMFSGCKILNCVDLSSFDTQLVTDMRNMFANCEKLKTIYASDKFVTKAVTKGEFMFTGCKVLEGAVKYDKNKVTHEMANLKGYFTTPVGTGIEQAVTSNNGKAEYYNLQGHRLNAPQKGINIVKHGNKTQKILVK